MKSLGNSIKANHPEISYSHDGPIELFEAMHSVCDPELPHAGEGWEGVVENMDQWWMRFVAAIWNLLDSYIYALLCSL
jgi:hypothetical protein